jgi:hypothetical protein
MRELLTSGVVLCLAMAGHVAFWRVWPPRRDTVALLAVGGGAMGVVIAASGLGLWPLGPDTLPGWVQVVLAAAAAWLAYCELYLAIKSQSPSSQMLLYAARHPQGVLREELLAVVANGPAEDERVESLVNGSLVQRTRAGFEPTPAGRRLAGAISILGGIYRLPPAVRKPREPA